MRVLTQKCHLLAFFNGVNMMQAAAAALEKVEKLNISHFLLSQAVDL